MFQSSLHNDVMRYKSSDKGVNSTVQHFPVYIPLTIPHDRNSQAGSCACKWHALQWMGGIVTKTTIPLN